MSNFDFGSRRDILKENLTEPFQNLTLEVRGYFERKFDGTLSNFDFRSRRDILKENLTEPCQFLTLEV